MTSELRHVLSQIAGGWDELGKSTRAEVGSMIVEKCLRGLAATLEEEHVNRVVRREQDERVEQSDTLRAMQRSLDRLAARFDAPAPPDGAFTDGTRRDYCNTP